MKKTMLWGALFTLICTQLHAEATQQAVQSQTPDTTNSSVTTTQTPAVNQNTSTQTNPVNQVNQPNQNTQQNQYNQTQTTQPVQTTTQQPGQNIQPQTTEQAPVEQQQTTQVINCDYKIPTETKTIDQTLILTWAEKATTQAFDFEPASLDVQLQKLQACFTDQGWQSFNSALQKSGNIEAIKTQNLTVSSQLDGQAQMTEATENEWKITLPMQVVYQNNKEKVTQLLTVNLTIGRKVTGDLGITQMIATPRPAAVIQQSNNPAPTNSSTTPNNVDTGSTTTGTTPPPTSTNSNTTNTNTNTQNPPSNNGATVPTNTNTPPTSTNNGTDPQNSNSGTVTTIPGSSN